jgi:cyclophilin family peptidyl-prolyl cis-trans isomerase
MGSEKLDQKSKKPSPVAIGVLVALLAASCQKPLIEKRSTPPIPVNPETGWSTGTWVIETTQGSIQIQLAARDAPTHVARFLELVDQGFYNGLKFFNIEPKRLIQTGDPKNNGLGGSGKRIPAEFNRIPHIEGTLGFARQSKPDSADSQFYITLIPLHTMDLNYTVFGRVVSGLDVAYKITEEDRILKIRPLD